MADQGVTYSMSRSVGFWNNAAIDGLLSSLKTERTARNARTPWADIGQTCSITSSTSTVRRVSIGHWAV